MVRCNATGDRGTLGIDLRLELIWVEDEVGLSREGWEEKVKKWGVFLGLVMKR